MEPTYVHAFYEDNHRLAIYEENLYKQNEAKIAEDVNSYAISCIVLPKEKTFLQTIQEKILTLFKWRWIPLHIERENNNTVLVNVNSIRQKTGLGKKFIRDQNYQSILYQTIADRLGEKISPKEKKKRREQI